VSAREVVIDRAGASDVPRTMQRVEKSLLGAGYSVSARGFSELQLVTTRGGPLRATVQFTAARVRFVFAPAAPGTAMPSEAELTALVDAALGDGSAPAVVSAAAPLASGGQRCGICATVIPVGAPACPLCGMATR
jgi:hypothetical protein